MPNLAAQELEISVVPRIIGMICQERFYGMILDQFLWRQLLCFARLWRGSQHPQH